MKNKTGCWICEWFLETTYYKEMSNEIESWEPECDKRDYEEIENFKTFPCKRKLKCWESKEAPNE